MSEELCEVEGDGGGGLAWATKWRGSVKIVAVGWVERRVSVI